jgi:hypothetical protein
MGVLSNMLHTITTVTNPAHIAAQANGMRDYIDKPRMKNKTIFSGRIEVQQVCNGYIVHIASREGYEFDSHIAATVKDVNELIATAIVAFQLEGK